MSNLVGKFVPLGLKSCPLRWVYDVESWKPTKEEYELAICCVQPEEKDRICAFYYSEDTKSSLIGRLLLRTAASLVLGVSFQEVQFGRSEKGRPFISSHDDLKEHNLTDLNISHQGRYCVLAAEANSAVGIDVATTKYSGYLALPEYFNLMQRKFTTKEWNFICGPVPEIEQGARFFRLWALKESFVKAEGSGLGFELQRLSFRCPTAQLSTEKIVSDTELFIDGLRACDWKFEETLLDNDYCTAVAIQKVPNCKDNEVIPSFQLLDFNKLKEFCKPLRNAQTEDWEQFHKKLTKQKS